VRNSIEDCTESELRRIRELIVALRTKCNTCINPESTLINDLFAEEFLSRLLSQHVFMGSPLFQENFDAAFVSSALVSGMKVEHAAPGQRFWDIRLDGRNISLKSSKAKSLKADTLSISKLTEAAWIQDCRTKRRRMEFTRDLFREYTEEVWSIFQLRYFLPIAKYELVEIPVRLFEQVLSVPESEFDSDGPTISIPIGQIPPDFRLKLDRSDAKVTIVGIRKELCIVHGSWQILGSGHLKSQ
jgi:hypothetical protein